MSPNGGNNVLSHCLLSTSQKKKALLQWADLLLFFYLIEIKCRFKRTGRWIFITAWIQLPAEDIYKHNMIHGEPF